MKHGEKFIEDEEDKRFLREYRRRTKGFEIHATADSGDEGSFSWRECDTCGSRKGGNRTACVLTNPGVDKAGRRRRQVRVSSCDDCIFYAAYGTLPSQDG